MIRPGWQITRPWFLVKPGAMHQWLLTDRNGQSASIPCKVRFASDDMSTLKNAAALSLGARRLALPTYVNKRWKPDHLCAYCRVGRRELVHKSAS
jgi:hypothetical protein